MKCLVAAVLLCTVSTRASSEPGVVVLRNGIIVNADDVTVTDQAVTVLAGNRESVYGWHDVADVESQGQEGIASHLQSAEEAWRGVSRLKKGDRVAAEPALETAFLAKGRSIGPTAATVSEGLLVCRLSRGAQALAVEPYLYVLLNASEPQFSESIDQTYDLCVSLPPIWGTRSGLSAMVSALSAEDYSAWSNNDRVLQLAQLYAAAAVHEISGRVVVPNIQPSDEGVRVIHEIVLSQAGSASERSAARDNLSSRLNQNPPDWLCAWIHAAIGTSLLVEADDSANRLGIVQLLHVPAKYGDSQPYLSGVCLSRAALKLDEMGRRTEARLLAQTFNKHYEFHVAGDDLGMKLLLQSNEEDAVESNSRQEGV
ncbi:MAG: hypothetical protein Phyf2KO_04090 [Phycisphaerales bacterium]